MQNNYLRHLGSILDDKKVSQKTKQRLKMFAATVSAEVDAAEDSVIIPPEFNPKDWLSFLIHIDAELEHGLMVQYLYAAYSMGGDQIEEKDREKVRRWQEIILGIAKEEMGHFVSVQNVLRVLGAPLNFGRQDFPWDSTLYPFEFSLEPFTLDSLAKYVYAESPVGWLNSPSRTKEMAEIKKEIKKVIDQEDHGDPVGALFDQILKIIKDPKLIPDDVFLADTYSFQAKFNEWGRGYKGGARGNSTKGNIVGTPDVLVEPVSSRTNSINALEEIAEQGESTSPDNALSHFERFLGIYRELRKMPEGFSPSRNVAFNPTIADEIDDPTESPSEGLTATDYPIDVIKNPRAQLWANLFNVRYRMLLTFLKHSFLIDDGFNYSGSYSPRGAIINATFGEMYNLRSISNVLVRLPIEKDSKVMAGPPFLIPYTMDLPFGEKSKWNVHKDLIEASRRLIDQLLPIADATNRKYLNSLIEADRLLNDIATEITK